MIDYNILLNKMVDSFQITELIGKGGMGAVFKAYDHQNQRWVALKIINPKLLTQPDLIQQFKLEAEAATGLNHHNIAQLFYIGSFNNIPYYAMEYIIGNSFADIFKERGRFTGLSCMNYLYQICDGLEYCHVNGIIHRDIKPANIMLTNEGMVKVVDFGLAMVLQEGFKSSESEQILGTPKYISPEAGTTKLLDHRSDIYSLGATFYHLIAGEPPFTASTPMELLNKHISEPLIPLKERNPRVPELVSDMIFKMMEKKPKDRYQSYSEIKKDVQTAKATGFRKTKEFKIVTTAENPKLSHNKRKLPVVLYVLIGVIIILFGFFIIIQDGKKGRMEEAAKAYKESKPDKGLDIDKIGIKSPDTNPSSPGGGRPSPYPYAGGGSMSYIGKAQRMQTMAKMKQIESMLLTYLAEKDEMPVSVNQLITDYNVYGLTDRDSWGGIIEIVDNGGREYSIMSAGPDGVWNTGDDIILGKGATKVY
jgi:serine/threonine protein kinase